MKMCALVILIAAMVAGCATSFPMPKVQPVTLTTGQTIDYVTLEGKDAAGLNSRVVDRWWVNPKGELIFFGKSEFGGQGIMNAFMTGGFAGLAQGLGFFGGMSMLRPSSTGGDTTYNNLAQEQGQGQYQDQRIQYGYKKHFQNAGF